MLQAAEAALEARPEINLHRYPIGLSIEDGVVVMHGEVENIVAKRLARRELAALFGVEHVLDRLRVAPGKSQRAVTLEDAWYLLDVHAVDNRPRVQVPESTKGPPLRAALPFVQGISSEST
jgi:hypothetical protein